MSKLESAVKKSGPSEASSAPSPTATSFDHLLHDGQPRWDQIVHAVTCSRCAYNLRGLAEPRCPECGLDFHWPDILDRSRWHLDWLFEHNWRKWPIRSYFGTLARAMRPTSFWRALSIHAPVRPGALWFFLATGVVCFFLTLHSFGTCTYLIIEWLYPFRMPTMSTDSFEIDLIDEVRWFSQAIGFEVMGFMPYYLIFPGVAMIWCILVLAFLCSLRQTLGNHRVRTALILRVVSYSFVPSAILAAPLLFALLVTIQAFDLWRGRPSYSFLTIFIPPLIISLSIIAFPANYVGTGLRVYLGLPRPRVLAWTAMIVAELTMLALATLIQLVVLSGF